MDVIRYYRDGRPWDFERIEKPIWKQVEQAIRRMDNDCFPIVQLNTTEDDEADHIFNICGGSGRWALFQMMGEWEYTDPTGGQGEVRLWESDQGYFCKEKNILTDVEKVLQITRVYFETGSYNKLEAER